MWDVLLHKLTSGPKLWLIHLVVIEILGACFDADDDGEYDNVIRILIYKSIYDRSLARSLCFFKLHYYIKFTYCENYNYDTRQIFHS